ncbi:MAG: tRNA-dihydrouridine synthase [Candidatus Anstonellaceae archaeon]
MKFGLSEISGRFVLGPMAGYTDIAFRLLCRKKGAAMCFTEFANATAIVRGAKAALNLISTCKEEMPVAIQIFGSDKEMMASCCRKISQLVQSEEIFASCIDLNFGCPALSVVKAGSGAALLKSPEKIRQIVAACVKASHLPITCKIRAGWSQDNAVVIAKLIEQEGAAGITVHWRFASGTNPKGWKTISEVKQAVNIPVIGNGGADSATLAVKLLIETKCDAAMISSGALGNPAIFAQSNFLLEGKSITQYSRQERKADLMEYLLLAKKYNCFSLKHAKAHAVQFFAGWPGAKKARSALATAKTEEDLLQLLHKL